MDGWTDAQTRTHARVGSVIPCAPAIFTPLPLLSFLVHANTTGEDGRAFPKCLLFRGNLRGDEGMARVNKAMASLPGRSVNQFVYVPMYLCIVLFCGNLRGDEVVARVNKAMASLSGKR